MGHVFLSIYPSCGHSCCLPYIKKTCCRKVRILPSPSKANYGIILLIQILLCLHFIDGIIDTIDHRSTFKWCCCFCLSHFWIANGTFSCCTMGGRTNFLWCNFWSHKNTCNFVNSTLIKIIRIRLICLQLFMVSCFKNKIVF